MKFVLQRTADRAYVARSNSRGSYTAYLQYARVFHTREEAERERCPDNERILAIEDALEAD